MSTLRIYRGLPASGKSTVARAWVDEAPQTRIRVNRDELRLMMYARFAGLSPNQEAIVAQAEHAMARRALQQGIDVAADAMNLEARFAKQWVALAQDCAAGWEIVDVPTDVETCVARDSGRHEALRVGEQVIRTLARRHPYPWPSINVDSSPAAYYPNQNLPPAWIVDVDGTLAHIASDRNVYDAGRGMEDAVDPAIRAVVNALASQGNAILICSGRTDDTRDILMRWLNMYGIAHTEIHMRAVGDKRRDSVVKAEMLHRRLASRYNVLGAIDDRQQVVDMWRGIGLTCLQVGEGEF